MPQHSVRTDTLPFYRVMRYNSDDTSHVLGSSLYKWTTEPVTVDTSGLTGNFIVGNVGYNILSVIPIGKTNNGVGELKVWGVRKAEDLSHLNDVANLVQLLPYWFAVPLVAVQATLTSAVAGAADYVLQANELGADSISVSSGTWVAAYTIDALVADEIAAFDVDLRGYQKYAISFNNNPTGGTDTTELNALVSQY